MNITMNLIDPPLWTHSISINITPEFSKKEYEQIQNKRNELLEMLHTAVLNYIDTCNNESRSFPEVQKLTGEYYINSEYYLIKQHTCQTNAITEKNHHFSITVHCLEKCWYPNQQDQDYLGLEVHFRWCPSEQKIDFIGDIDSSSI